MGAARDYNVTRPRATVVETLLKQGVHVDVCGRDGAVAL